ncbi:MAG: helix-turn-helix domain-containing protein [Candidatus Omnitrophica bacterium]|nr:helix-turn-helix domain-containing protein [Candidatus Omnitrophota bacterium]
MSEEKLLTVRDASLLLEVSEKDVLDLAEKGTLPAYKVGGVYLRFKKEQVDEYRKTHQNDHHKSGEREKVGRQDKIRDFLYFNDFYIFATILIILLGLLVYRGF